MVHSELDARDVASLREVKPSTELMLAGRPRTPALPHRAALPNRPRRRPAPQAEIER